MWLVRSRECSTCRNVTASDDMLYLERFRPRHGHAAVYEFDHTTHRYGVAPIGTGRSPAAQFAGFADERWIGLFRRRSVFVAVYICGDLLCVYLDGTMFSWPSSLKVTRIGVAPLVKSFQVHNGTTLWTCRYWNNDGQEWDYPDIFAYVARAVESPESVAETVCILRAREAGGRLEEYVGGSRFKDDVIQYMRQAHYQGREGSR